MMKRLGFFLLVLFSSPVAMASPRTLIFQDLQLDFSYEDYNFECDAIFEPVPALSLVAEIEESRVKRAYLKKRVISGTEEIVTLSAEELMGMAFFEWQGKTWLRSLAISQRTIEWLLHYADSSATPCRPPQPLSTMKPAFQVFKFPDMYVWTKAYLPSERATFSGITQNGEDYLVEMRLLQSQTRPGLGFTWENQ